MYFVRDLCLLFLFSKMIRNQEKSIEFCIRWDLGKIFTWGGSVKLKSAYHPPAPLPSFVYGTWENLMKYAENMKECEENMKKICSR